MHARLTCQISVGAALHGLLRRERARGAGEAFGITPCSRCVCARDICTGCELYALPAAAIQAQPVTLCPPATAGKLTAPAAALVSEHTFSAFSGPN